MSALDIKHCGGCKEIKPLSAFGRVNGQPRARCKACVNAARRADYQANPARLAAVRAQNLARYGLTSEDYDRMVAEQDGRCAVCRQPERKVMHGKVIALSVDHDHKTGAVRQLLCASCNTVIGHLETNLVDPHLFVAYLDRHAATVEA